MDQVVSGFGVYTEEPGFQLCLQLTTVLVQPNTWHHHCMGVMLAKWAIHVQFAVVLRGPLLSQT